MSETIILSNFTSVIMASNFSPSDVRKLPLSKAFSRKGVSINDCFFLIDGVDGAKSRDHGHKVMTIISVLPVQSDLTDVTK